MPRKRKKRRRRRGLVRLLRPLSFILAAVAIVAALTLFFKVENIVVTGAGRYQIDEIIAASGVKAGDNLILLDRYRISQRIYTSLPYITSVTPRPELPGTLVIEVTETQAAAAIQGAGGYWLISGSGKLLEAADQPTAADYLQIVGIEAELPAVSEPLLLPEDSPLTSERLTELLSVLSEHNALTRADSLDCSDRQTLVLNYDGRFRVELYYDADFEFKVHCLLAALEKLEPNENGTLRMTMKDDNEVRFIPSSG